MSLLSVDRMAADVRGEGDAVVFIHGLGGSLNAWTPLLPALPRSRLVRIDLPGAGRSHKARSSAAQSPCAYPIIPCEATPAGGQFSSFMPSDRPRWASTSLISVSDFLPRFGVFSSSTSVFWIRSPM